MLNSNIWSEGVGDGLDVMIGDEMRIREKVVVLFVGCKGDMTVEKRYKMRVD